jgi:hypothetical protein
MPGLDDYGALLRSGTAAVPDYASQEAEQQMVALRRAEAQAQLAQVTEKLQQRQQFGADVTSVLADPNPRNVSALIMKHPEYADQVKSGWDLREKATRDRDLTQLGEIYSAAQAGKWDVAARAARTRFEADKAAGQADPTEESIVTALEGQNPADRNAALGMIGVQIAANTGAEHFGTVYGALQGDYTMEEGAARFNRSGQMIAHSPFIKDAEGNIRLWTDVPGATPASDGAPAPPPADPARVPATVAGLQPDHVAVASTLSAGGLPAPVVAGFLGNFHAEGGYGGAKGDGGSATGIGQWRDARAANFERVVGKPVSEASPQEQAGFVLWEMQHPEAAGMTQGQVDAIMASKTAPQAAALIDQFYERSDGTARSRRMAAAASIAAGAGVPTAAPGAAAATGSERFPIAIPGKPTETSVILTKEQAAAAGLPTNQVYKQDTRTKEITPVSGTAEAAEALDPATVSFYAQQILAGGQMPALGFGKPAAAARQAIMREVARSAQSLGITGRDLATQQAHFKNATAALKTLETQAATIGANEETAILNGQQFLDRSRELPKQTGFPAFNSAIQALQRNVPIAGHETVVAMDAAWKTFTDEYAKVVAGSPSGAGVLSDSARQHAYSIMRGNYAYEQKEAVFNQMKKDMANRMAAIRAGIAHGYKDMSRIPGSTRELSADSGTAGLPPGAKVVGTYQGKRVIEVNGKRMVEQ